MRCRRVILIRKVHPTQQRVDVQEETTMFARSLTLRTSGLFASIVLTGAMLGAIGGLAQTQHADPAVAASHSVAPELNRVPG
jgi:PBP1b-binding outer membrane lipoprotein LpoB